METTSIDMKQNDMDFLSPKQLKEWIGISEVRKN